MDGSTRRVPTAIPSESMQLRDDGRIPNNDALPLVIYRGVLPKDEEDPAAACEALFACHGWGAAWRDGIYSYHHFHATTHEVLGIVRGTVSLKIGGESGAIVVIGTGDVAIIPAGVGHKRETASEDLLVVGAYPGGAEFDTCTAADDHKTALAAIKQVPLPAEDPVFGIAGPLFAHWRRMH
jgi:uncharacterized protein YjlB